MRPFMKVMVSFFCEWWLYSRLLLLFSCPFHFDIIDINGNSRHNCGEFLEKSSTREPNNYDLELNCNDPLWRQAWSKIGKTRKYISLSPRIEGNYHLQPTKFGIGQACTEGWKVCIQEGNASHWARANMST